MSSPKKKQQHAGKVPLAAAVINLPSLVDSMDKSMDDTNSEDFTKNQQTALLMKNNSGRLKFFNTLQKQPPILVPETSISQLESNIALKSFTNMDHPHITNTHPILAEGDESENEADESIDAIRRGEAVDHAVKPHTTNLNLNNNDNHNNENNSSIVESPLHSIKLNFSSNSKITSRKRLLREEFSPLKNIPDLNNKHSSANKLENSHDSSLGNLTNNNNMINNTQDNSPGVLHNSKPLNQIPALTAPSPTTQSSPLLDIKMISPTRDIPQGNILSHGRDSDEMTDMSLSPVGSMVKKRKTSLTNHHHFGSHEFESNTLISEINKGFNDELVSYQVSFEEKNKRISNLVQDCYKFEQDLIQLTEIHDSLKFEKSQLLKNYEIANFEKKNFENKYNENNKELQRKTQDFQQLLETNHDLITKEENFQKELNENLKDIEILEKNLNQLKHEHSENLLKLETTSQERDSDKKEIDSLLRLKTELSEKIDAQQEQINKQAEKFQNYDDTLIEKYENLQAESTKQINELTSVLENQTDELKQKIAIEESLLKTKKEMIDKSQEQAKKIESLQSELDLQKREILFLKKDDVESTSMLHVEIKNLKQEIDTSQRQAESQVEILTKENAILKTQLANTAESEQTLKETIDALNKKVDKSESEFNKTLDKLGDDLHIQYAKKHVQKVEYLKKLYEKKHKEQVAKIIFENNQLNAELEKVKKQLSQEREEKENMVNMLNRQQQQQRKD